MAYSLDIRINGVTKMADQIEDIPAFHFDGKRVTIVADLINDPPGLDLPKISYDEIQSALESEEPSVDPQGDPESPQAAPEASEKADENDPDDGQSSQLDDQPRRKGGRHKTEDSDE